MSWTLYPLSEFKSLQDDWERLNHGPCSTALLSLACVLPMLRVFGTGQEMVGRYETGGRLRAMTILTPKGRGAWETFQPSQAPLGLWVSDGKELDWQRLVAALIGRLPGFALAVGITQQDPLLLPRPADSGTVRTLDHVKTAGIAISGSFDDYWNARSKNLRANLRTQANKLRKSGIVTRLERVTEPGQVAEAIAAYGWMESTGWKAKAGTAVHPDNSQGKFYRQLYDMFYANGTGRIFRYWYNDRLVATHLCVEANDTFIVLKMAYDEAIGNDTSPSLLMLKEIFQQLFDERRVVRIESYGKLVEWNSKWYDEVRSLYHITGYRWSVLPALRDLRRRRPVELSR